MMRNIIRRVGLFLGAGNGEHGQALVMFATGGVAFVGLVGMSVDVGNLVFNRTQLQSTSDAAALAGASVIGAGSVAVTAEAQKYVQANGGADSVTVNFPPASGPHAGDSSYVEVIVHRTLPKYFIGVVYSGAWETGSRSVAKNTGAGVLGNNFVALRSDCAAHTLKVQLGGKLTVNGAIYVNSGNSDKSSPAGPLPCGNENKGGPGYGDGFDVFGAGGTIAAKQIVVHGGWETHNNDIVTPAPLINQPILADPLASVSPPNLANYTVRNGSAAAPQLLTISGGSTTLQPGVYYGGIAIKNSASVTLTPGVYIMAGGGLSVANSASLSGSGVMIYNTKANVGGKYAAININTTSAVHLTAGASGYAGLLIFQDRAATTNVILNPGNGISGLQGTVYSSGWKPSGNSDVDCPGSTTDTGSATTVIGASGTANLQVISAQILICGANATFQFNSNGLANNGGVPIHVSLTE